LYSNANVRLGGTPTFPAARVRGLSRRLGWVGAEDTWGAAAEQQQQSSSSSSIAAERCWLVLDPDARPGDRDDLQRNRSIEIGVDRFEHRPIRLMTTKQPSIGASRMLSLFLASVEIVEHALPARRQHVAASLPEL